MSRKAFAALPLTTTAPQAGPGPAPSPQTWPERLDAINSGPSYSWRFTDAPGTVLTARNGSVNGTFINPDDIIYQTGTLVENSDGGNSTIFGGSENAPARVEISVDNATGIQLASEVSIRLSVQLDQTKPKVTVFTTDEGGQVGGTFALEFVDDGAGGMKPRCFCWRADGEPVVYVGANAATVPIARSFPVDFIKQDGSLRVFVDGSEVLLDLDPNPNFFPAPAQWPATPSGSTLHVGAWPTGANPFDGAIAELAIYNSYIFTQTDIDRLNTPTNISYLADFNFGDVTYEGLVQIPLSPYASPYDGIIPEIVSQGTIGVASIDGQDLRYQANNEESGSDSFTVRFVANGLTSNTATVSVEVLDSGIPTSPAGDWPHFGLAVGNVHPNVNPSNNKCTGSTVETCQGFFFYSDREMPIKSVLLHWRFFGNGAYSDGNGGLYRIEVRKANPANKMPLDGASNLMGVSAQNNQPPAPGTSGNTHVYIPFASNFTLIKGQPYFFCIINVASNPADNYTSNNITVHYTSSSNDLPARGYIPLSLPGTSDPMHPWSTCKRWETYSVNAGRKGPGKFWFVYTDDKHGGPHGTGVFSVENKGISVVGSTRLRHRFRPPTDYSFTTDAVEGHYQRKSGTGNLIVGLYSHSSDTLSGTGTLIEEVTIPHGDIASIGGRDSYIFSGDNPQIIPFVRRNFSQNRTLNANNIYSLAFRVTGSLHVRIAAGHRGSWLNSASNFDDYFANLNQWGCWDWSLGCERSTNSGSSWGFPSQRLELPVYLTRIS